MMLADLVDDGVLRLVRENHLFEFVTINLFPGFKAGRRCRKCKQWAMGDFPGDSADEVCPKAVYRYVSDWFTEKP